MARRIHPPQVSTTVPFDTMEWGDAKQSPLAAAPTPVEPECAQCHQVKSLLQLVNGPAICLECDEDRREMEKYV